MLTREVHEHNIRRWLDDESREWLTSRRDDPHVRALMAALAHCHGGAEANKLMAQTIFQMSHANAHMLKLATEAVSLRPLPPLFLVNSEIEHIDGDPMNNEITNIRIVGRKP